MKIRFYLFKSRLKDGVCPLMCRVTIDNKRSAFATNLLLQPEFWDQKRQCIVHQELSIYNKEIVTIKEDLTQSYNALVDSGLIPAPKKVIEKYKSGNVRSVISLTQMFDKYIEWSASTKSSFKDRTKLKYTNIQNKIYDFGDVDIHLIDKKYISEFHSFLKSQGLSHNHTVKSMRILGAIITYAYNYDYLDKNPFKGYIMKSEKKDLVYLTKDELQQIENIKLDQRLEKVRDMFIFQCYTGMEYSRIKSFDQSNMIKGIDGQMWAVTKRMKNNETVNAPILDRAMELIVKYQTKKRETIFPVISIQKYNMYLKEIMKLCGIDKRITTHIARHTFATTVLLLNGVSWEVTSKLLGHKSISTTQRYYGDIVPRRVADEINLLKERLNVKIDEKLKKAKD